MPDIALSDMATETQTGLSGHLRGVTVTTIACLAGTAAGLASALVAGTGIEAASNQQTLLILGVFVLGQFPLLRLVGVDVQGFGPKDHLYLVFMTFTLWFITFAILLTSGATVAL